MYINGYSQAAGSVMGLQRPLPVCTWCCVCISAEVGRAQKKLTPIEKQQYRDEMAAKYRDKMAWTKGAFRAIGEAAADAEADAELIALSPDGSPDIINGTAAWFDLDNIPTEAIIGLSVAVAILVVIVLVLSLLVVMVSLRQYRNSRGLGYVNTEGATPKFLRGSNLRPTTDVLPRPFSPLYLRSLPLLFPSLPLEVDSSNTARKSAGAFYVPSSRSGQSPSRKRIWCLKI